MADEELSMLDWIIETHRGLDRQGPGSTEMTLKALGLIGSLNGIARTVNMGCGTGGETMVLAQHLPASSVLGIDNIPDFIDAFNGRARQMHLNQRVKGMVGSIEELEELDLRSEEFDLIWSEGVIDSIGFEKGLSYWSGFLKKGGYVAVTCPSWLSETRPAEIEKFWVDAVQGLDTVDSNIAAMGNAGLDFIAAFTLPESCWTENYFAPRTAAEQLLHKKYPGNRAVQSYIEESNYEVELYSKYHQYYGYVFYIGKKV